MFRLLLVVMLAFILAGCKTELYSNISEREANEMLAILMTEGIYATKAPGKDQAVILMVNESDVARAIDILKRNGYPRERFPTVEELFPKDGLIASPIEERARLIFAKSQEIAETLTQIDGVLTARVHVVYPQKKDRDTVGAPASVSVFIKHLAEIQMDSYVPQIKLMVNNSIPDLNYDRISVVLFPSAAIQNNNQESLTSVLSIKVAKNSRSTLIALLVSIVLIAIAAQSSMFYWYRRQIVKRT